MFHSIKPRHLYVLSAISFALLLCATTRPQQPNSTSVLRLTTRVVNINVVVTDRQGNPVTGLTKDDFTLMDGGQIQKISFFSAADNEQPSSTPAAPPAPGFYTNTPTGTAAAPGVTILLFDTLNSHWTSQGYGLQGLRKFVRQLEPRDHLGVYVLGDDLTVVHDFVRDSSDLVAAIKRYDDAHSPGAKKVATSEENSGDVALDRFLTGKDLHYQFWIEEGTKTGAYVRDHQATAIQTTTAWLEIIARQLSGVPGRKSLIWVTDSIGQLGFFDNNDLDEYLTGWQKDGGVSVPGTILSKNGEDVERMIRAMNNAGLAVYTVDAKGLQTMDLDFRNTSTPSSLGPPADDVGAMLGAIPRPDPNLLELSARTGGRAFYNRNDLQTGIRRALDDSRYTYELAYYPDHNRWKGEWRKIQVKVNRPDATVLARAGYFALPDPRPLPAKGRIEFLSQIAASPLNAAQLPLSVQITSFMGATGRELTARVHLNPQSMLSIQENGHWKGNFEIVFMQIGAKNKLLDATQKDVEADLDAKKYAEVSQKGWDLPTILKLMPGATVLSVILHDKSSDAAGSVRIPLDSSSPPTRPH